MKLLFDHNLSPKLVARLNDLYPNSNHLYLMNLDKEPNYIIWGIAKTENYTLITKDSDIIVLFFYRVLKMQLKYHFAGMLSGLCL